MAYSTSKAPRGNAALRALIALHPEEWRAALQHDPDDGEPTEGVARMWHDAWPPLPPGGHRPSAEGLDRIQRLVGRAIWTAMTTTEWC
jgi:hypothetical protein